MHRRHAREVLVASRAVNWDYLNLCIWLKSNAGLVPFTEVANQAFLCVQERQSGKRMVGDWTSGPWGTRIAGRGRRYGRIVIDEAVLTKNGDSTVDDSMMSLR